jgi:hypothetical protein
MKLQRSSFLAATLLLPLLSGCIAVAAGAGVGYLVSKEVLPNDVHSAQVRVDVEEVWSISKETLGFMVDPKSTVESQTNPRVARAKVDGADVRLEVEAYDIDRTIIKVQAERALAHDSATAESVLNRILDRIGQENVHDQPVAAR